MKRRVLPHGKYYLIYMKLSDEQKKQIEEDLAAFTNEYAGKTIEEIGLPEDFLNNF